MFRDLYGYNPMYLLQVTVKMVKTEKWSNSIQYHHHHPVLYLDQIYYQRISMQETLIKGNPHHRVVHICKYVPLL